MPDDWRHEFRAIYTATKKKEGPPDNSPNERDPPRLSGVGAANWVVPHIFPPSEELDSLVDTVYENLDLIGRGFIAHEMCWEIFGAVSRPNEIDYTVLWAFLTSMPYSFGRVEWGNDYENIYSTWEGHREPPNIHKAWTPWQDFVLNNIIRPSRWHTCHFDPCSLFRDLVASRTKKRRSVQDIDKSGMTSEDSIALPPEEQRQNDMFWKLPHETRELIMINLDSQDVPNIRLASQAFAALGLTQSFWATRFSRASPWDYVYEARAPIRAREYMDWKSLFTGMSARTSSYSAKNRRRIWDIVERLDLLISPYVGVSCAGEAHLEATGYVWGTIEADIAYTQWGVTQCSTMLKSRRIRMRDIAEIYVSISPGNPVEYIASLRFISEDGIKLSIGYVLKGHEVHVDLRRRPDPTTNPANVDDTKQNGKKIGLRGISLSVLKQGMTGIRFFTNTGWSLRFAGTSSRDSRHWRDLLIRGQDPIEFLEAQFDGYKMLSLGIGHAWGMEVDRTPRYLEGDQLSYYQPLERRVSSSM